MAVTASDLTAPRWPGPIDASALDLHYEPDADELTLFFSGRSVPAYSDPIAGAGGALMVKVGLDGADAGTVVGVHVYPFRASGYAGRPEWAALADPSPPVAAVRAFVADVAALFFRHGVR